MVCASLNLPPRLLFLIDSYQAKPREDKAALEIQCGSVLCFVRVEEATVSLHFERNPHPEAAKVDLGFVILNPAMPRGRPHARPNPPGMVTDRMPSFCSNGFPVTLNAAGRATNLRIAQEILAQPAMFAMAIGLFP